MIFLIILLIIIGLIALLLLTPVKAKFSYIDGKLFYSVSYFLYPFFSSVPKKKKRKKKVKKEVSTNQDKSEKNDEVEQNNEKTKTSAPSDNVKKKKTKKSIGENVQLFLDVWNCGNKHLKRIFKGFHFSKVSVDVKISDEDAYKCALKYGRTCFAVYNSLNVLCRIFSIKADSVDVYCVFGEDSCKYNFSFTARFRLATAVNAGLGFLLTYYLKILRPQNKKLKRKSPVKQKAAATGK